MAQTKKGSIAEAWANIAVGFTINYFANLTIFPLFGMHIGALNNFYMGCIYTVISLVRSYVLRRWFNGLKFGNVPRDLDGERQHAYDAIADQRPEWTGYPESVKRDHAAHVARDNAIYGRNG